MENEKIQKDKETLRNSVRTLQQRIVQDISKGQFMGLAQQVRSIQKTISLGMRV